MQNPCLKFKYKFHKLTVDDGVRLSVVGVYKNNNSVSLWQWSGGQEETMVMSQADVDLSNSGFGAEEFKVGLRKKHE